MAQSGRKVLLVDGQEAFTGGINLHSDNITRPGALAIRDYHFHVRGPIVQELQYTFLRDWYFVTDDDPELLLRPQYFPHVAPAGDESVRVVNSGPTDEMETIADVMFTAVTAARRTILAVTPYFVPAVDLLRAFRSAAHGRVGLHVMYLSLA